MSFKPKFWYCKQVLSEVFDPEEIKSWNVGELGWRYQILTLWNASTSQTLCRISTTCPTTAQGRPTENHSIRDSVKSGILVSEKVRQKARASVIWGRTASWGPFPLPEMPYSAEGPTAAVDSPSSSLGTQVDLGCQNGTCVVTTAFCSGLECVWTFSFTWRREQTKEIVRWTHPGLQDLSSWPSIALLCWCPQSQSAGSHEKFSLLIGSKMKILCMCLKRTNKTVSSFWPYN